MNQQDEINATRLLHQIFGSDVEIIDRWKIDVDWAPVERWNIQSPTSDVPTSIILKTRRHEENGWGGHPLNLVAERRALSYLNESSYSPRIYAYNDDQGVIVMEHIDGASTIEKLLFGSNPAEAVDALISMAYTVGAINGTTVGMLGGVWNPAASMIDDPVEKWREVCSLLRHHHFSELGDHQTEIQEIECLIRADEMRSLTHWDAVPCNALIQGERVVLVDFEGANPRHMAIDGAAFALAFEHYRYWAPLSDEVTDAMTHAWIDGVFDTWENAPERSEMLRHIAAAAVCRTLGRLTRLDRIADPAQPRASAIRRRSQIAETLRKMVRSCEHAAVFPALSHKLHGIELQMRERWPEMQATLLYPAFNGGKRDSWEIYHPI